VHIKFNTIAKEILKISKNEKHASLLDLFTPKAKKSKKTLLKIQMKM
jgi:hypothetical protein